MKILIFGATGMVGQGVLRECLASDDVETVHVVGRTPVAQRHPKLQQQILPDLFELGSVKDQLARVDACFFCLGVSSAGMSEEEYIRLTYDLTLGVAAMLARQNPDIVFIYVSGSGTDSTERSSTMWARVKGKTENHLMRLPFTAVGLFRPGTIIPMNGEQSKTRSYRLFYAIFKPLLKMLHRLSPNSILTTEDIGRAMLSFSKRSSNHRILEIQDIAKLARQ